MPSVQTFGLLNRLYETFEGSDDIERPPRNRIRIFDLRLNFETEITFVDRLHRDGPKRSVGLRLHAFSNDFRHFEIPPKERGDISPAWGLMSPIGLKIALAAMTKTCREERSCSRVRDRRPRRAR